MRHFLHHRFPTSLGRLLLLLPALLLGVPMVAQAIVITGTEADEVINGTDGPDGLFGKQGNDDIFGFGGDDELGGGQGEDFLDGGPGADRLFGKADDDELVGGTQNDILEGGGGHDTLRGGLGNDDLYGVNRGDDSPGEGEEDILIGGEDADRFFLADENGLYYRDEGFARIQDYSAEIDRLFLFGDLDDYQFFPAAGGRSVIVVFDDDLIALITVVEGDFFEDPSIITF